MPTTSELAEFLLETAPDHEGWSLVESPNSEGCFDELLDWARCMTLSIWNSDFSVRRPQLGLVLLWLESEVARRKGGEGTLWPILSDRQIVHWDAWVYGELFTGPGGATQKHRKLLEDTARFYGLRHTFGEEDGHNWYRLICLQFGFNHDDAVKRLAGWLSGNGLQFSVQRLLGDADSGAKSFQHLWHSIRAFRLGNLSQKLTESRLQESPWVLSDWCADLIAAATKSKAQALELGDMEAAEVNFFTTPQLTWDLVHQPVFTVSLCNLQNLELEAKDYRFMAGEVILARLMKQEDGGYHSDAGEQIVLPAKSMVPLSLVDPVSGEIAAHDEAILWDVQQEASLYSIRKGFRFLQGEKPRTGVELFLLASADLEIRPGPDASADLPLGYRLHHLARGWSGEIAATLDGDPIWSASATASTEAGVSGNMVSAWVESELDLRNDRWRDGPPWNVEVEFKTPKDWAIASIRQRSSGEGGVEWVSVSVTIDSFEGLEWNGGGTLASRVKKVVPVTEIDCLKPLLFRVGVKSGDKRRTELVRAFVPCVGVFKWDELGIPKRNTFGNNLLLSDARRYTWSFSLPKQPGEDTDSSVFQIREGNLIVASVGSGSRPFRIPNLGGYGAPLAIVRDPYQSKDEIMEVAPCVLDGGMLGSVTWLEEAGGFVIRSSFTDLGDDHCLFAWQGTEDEGVSVSEISRAKLLPHEDGWLWQSDNSQRLHALALTYRGTRLGSWFHHGSWSRAAKESSNATPAEIAAMLRAWKAPILKEDGDHAHTMASWLRQHLTSVLPIWLGKSKRRGPGGIEWKMPSPDAAWLAAVGDLLLEALPNPDADEAGQLVEALAPDHRGVEALNIALWMLLNVCPILAARLVKVYLAEFVSDQDGRFFREQIPLLITNELDAIDRIQTDDRFPARDRAVMDLDLRADLIAARVGKRSGYWLATTVGSLAAIEAKGTVTLSQAYRKLSKRQDYRLYCLSRWWNEL